MRLASYRLFEIVSWPAVVWCGAEIVMRCVTGDVPGAAQPGVLFAMAACTVVSCRTRAGQLRGPAAAAAVEPTRQ